jgi:hypothetical protein
MLVILICDVGSIYQTVDFALRKASRVTHTAGTTAPFGAVYCYKQQQLITT